MRTKTSAHDKFGHSQLGGVSNYLKNLIVSSSITTRVKTLELGVIQRCAMHLASDTDLKQAAEVGAYGIELSKKDIQELWLSLIEHAIILISMKLVILIFLK